MTDFTLDIKLFMPYLSAGEDLPSISQTHGSSDLCWWEAMQCSHTAAQLGFLLLLLALSSQFVRGSWQCHPVAARPTAQRTDSSFIDIQISSIRILSTSASKQAAITVIRPSTCIAFCIVFIIRISNATRQVQQQMESNIAWDLCTQMMQKGSGQQRRTSGCACEERTLKPKPQSPVLTICWSLNTGDTECLSQQAPWLASDSSGRAMKYALLVCFGVFLFL